MTDLVKILIVDDEPAIRRLIRRYAELEDYEVSEAGNGFEAVELCRKGSFDVIVMDIMMPDMDGFAATREIRKHCLKYATTARAYLPTSCPTSGTVTSNPISRSATSAAAAWAWRSAERYWTRTDANLAHRANGNVGVCFGLT